MLFFRERQNGGRIVRRFLFLFLCARPSSRLSVRRSAVGKGSGQDNFRSYFRWIIYNWEIINGSPICDILEQSLDGDRESIRIVCRM